MSHHHRRFAFKLRDKFVVYLHELSAYNVCVCFLGSASLSLCEIGGVGDVDIESVEIFAKDFANATAAAVAARMVAFDGMHSFV